MKAYAETGERFMNIRTTRSILSIALLAFALWLHPDPVGAQQAENTVDCVEGVGAIPLNYGDNTSGCAIDPSVDRDLFVFQGAPGTTVRVNVAGATSDLDSRVEVLDPIGTVLADQSCTAVNSRATCSVAVDLDLTVTGQYVIAVSDAGLDNTGDYSISVNCLYGSCPGANVPEIAYDVPVEETLMPRADMDIFTFQGAAGTAVRVNVAGATNDLDSRVEVRDPTGAVLDDQSCTAVNSTFTCSVAVDVGLTLTGQYTIAVSEAGLDNFNDNSTGSYSTSLNCLYGSCPGANVPEIAYDVPVEETLVPRADMDVFTFQGAAGTSVRVNVAGATNDLDSRVEVRDPTGAVLADQSCRAINSSATCSVAVDVDLTLTGQYTIAVSEAGLDNSTGNSTGSYSTSLNCLYGSCPGANVPEIAYDVPVEETLMPRADMDVFTFQGAAGTAVRVNVAGATIDLDSRVEVRDPTGAVLADQSCTTANSGATCSVAVDVDLTLTGQYTIAVSDVGLNDTGSYLISLNCVFGDSCLIIAPGTDFLLAGLAGGPFDPNTKDYTLTNNGVFQIDYVVSASQDFVTLSQTSGTLAGGTSTIVEVSINANANDLGPGNHVSTVNFINASNGQGNTDRKVELNVKCPGSITVTPATAFLPKGPPGGPFEPTSKTYTLTNPLTDVGGTLCGSDVDFSVGAVGNYINVSATSGTIESNGSTTVTISLNNNASSLPAGAYDSNITFIDTINHLGDTERGVTLVVDPTRSEPKPPWSIVPLLDLLLPDEPEVPDPP